MLADLDTTARRCGLRLHPEKTKIFCNATRRSGRTSAQTAEINSMNIQILSHEAFLKYLGKTTGLHKPQELELEARISTGWKKSMSLRDELTNKNHTIHNRIRLFESTVGATVLYGCECWTLTKTLETKLKRTQRKMLRMIMGNGRRRLDDGEIEPWIDWLKRTARAAEQSLETVGCNEWTSTVRKRQWKWAGRVAQMSSNRWAHVALHWTPQWSRGCRAQARPRMRWEDRIKRFLSSMSIEGGWHEVAKTPQWDSLEGDYVKFSV